MGFYVNESVKARCPLYERVVRSGQGRIAGVQCECLTADFGFSTSLIVRATNMAETLEMKRILCDDVYRACPYYQAWIKVNEKDQ